MLGQPGGNNGENNQTGSHQQPSPTGRGPQAPSLPMLQPLDHYRLQLYNYAVQAERLRCQQFISPGGAGSQYPGTATALCPPYPATAAYHPRLALSMSLFHHRVFQPEEPKPQYSYIGLIAMAILSSPDHKLVLSDIYQYILDNYPYFRTRGPGWRNSIRHNLSLNDCFVKAGRSANGKGHYWAIHPANVDDFKKGDFRRRKAQRKVRKHMGLAVEDDGNDSSSPPPPPLSPTPVGTIWTPAAVFPTAFHHHHHHHQTNHHHHHHNHHTNVNLTSVTLNNMVGRKRQFDVASLLAPDNVSEQILPLQERKMTAKDLPIKGEPKLAGCIDAEHSLDMESAPEDGSSSKRKKVYSSDEDVDVSSEEVDVVSHNAPNDSNRHPRPTPLHHSIASSPAWPLPLPAVTYQNSCFNPTIVPAHMDQHTNSLVARYYQTAARRLQMHRHLNNSNSFSAYNDDNNGDANSSCKDDQARMSPTALEEDNV
ncbi:forkhead box protein O1 [Nilaparvata lugens]|uniref:forkhead box protein O1 n=1 Tax=Nilaparvata lugens TaxID=108931 RepID=UPI00193D6092|nr:forkhead box protein O1 [Nilaparvata lugens]